MRYSGGGVVACLLGRDHESIHDIALNVLWVADCEDNVLSSEAAFAAWMSLRKWNVVVSVEAAGLEQRRHDVIKIHSTMGGRCIVTP